MELKKPRDWRIWAKHETYRGVWSMTCPNLPGFYSEDPDKEFAKAKIINHVCKHINDCKNSRRQVNMKGNDELPSPDPAIQVIEMHST